MGQVCLFSSCADMLKPFCDCATIKCLTRWRGQSDFFHYLWNMVRTARHAQGFVAMPVCFQWDFSSGGQHKGDAIHRLFCVFFQRRWGIILRSAPSKQWQGNAENFRQNQMEEVRCQPLVSRYATIWKIHSFKTNIFCSLSLPPDPADHFPTGWKQCAGKFSRGDCGISDLKSHLTCKVPLQNAGVRLSCCHQKQHWRLTKSW